MPKIKVHSGAAKRFRKVASGYKHKRTGRNHILTKMNTKRKRQLRSTDIISDSDTPLIRRMLRH